MRQAGTWDPRRRRCNVCPYTPPLKQPNTETVCMGSRDKLWTKDTERAKEPPLRSLEPKQVVCMPPTHTAT